MNNSWAKVVLDSVSRVGRRIVTVEARYWRAIHAELMTHRDRARNSASSRAIPFYREGKEAVRERDIPVGGVRVRCVGQDADGYNLWVYAVPKCTYSMVRSDPFVPEFIGGEKPGMQAGDELDGNDRVLTEARILRMRDAMLDECLLMYHAGVHKSIINRYLEPWSYITVVMTATEWNNFFRLRLHPKAERHFNKLAGQIKAAIDASKPQVLDHGQWHTPYVSPDEAAEIRDWAMTASLPSRLVTHRGQVAENAVKAVSAGRCARLSYLTHDGVRSFAEDVRLFNSLIYPKLDDERDDDVIHASPLEHVNMAHSDPYHMSGPMVGWHQFRKEFINENVSG